MIRAKAGNMLIFGLSEMNIVKLKEGKPIIIDGADMGAPQFEFAILYGETELAIHNDLARALHLDKGAPN